MARPVERIARDPHAPIGTGWPWRLPAVAQLLRDGLAPGALTVLVGENGSGKSTLLEGIALAYGMSAEGGSTGARHSSRPSESDLHSALQLRRGIGASRWGFFLRAETMHGYYTYLEDHPGKTVERFHDMSHGEGFLEVLASRFHDPGLYLLDEPESALSFTSCLALVGVLHDIVADENRQAVVATHSPIIAAVPGATIVEVSDRGLQRRDWADLELVQHWQAFLDDPPLYLGPLLEP